MNMKKWCMLLCCLMLLCCISGTAAAENKTETFRLEYYQYNSCASCTPQDAFYEIMREELGELNKEYPYLVHEYNPFHLEDQKRLKEQADALGIILASYNEPVLIVGNRMLIGLDEIRSEVKTAYEQLIAGDINMEEIPSAENGTKLNIEETAVQKDPTAEEGWRQKAAAITDEVKASDSVILYFSTMSCDDCARVKALLETLPAKTEVSGGSQSEIKVYEFNIMEEDNVELLQQLFAVRSVPREKQQVPILFYQDGFLSGANEAEDGLETALWNGAMQNFVWESEDDADPFLAGTYLSLFATGLVNGLNPCGASMLMMLLAAIAVSGKSIWKLGCSYLIGKFAAYLAMGLGLYHIFVSIDQEILLTVSRGITWIFAIVFFILAVMYLLDFIHARKQEYQKVRMQLPGVLRKWNHGMIEKMSKVSGRWLFPAVLLLGIIISAGEFFCTGQVYLAAILYLMKMPQTGGIQTTAAFLIYVAAMCIPSVLLVLLIEKTRNVIRASNTALAWMPFIKLATAAVFVALAVFMLLI